MLSDDRLHEIAERLMTVRGIEAVVLGGSRAKGTHHVDSDVDLGLYYDADTLDLAGLRDLASLLQARPAEIAGPGSWGPWVDGGAWLTIDGTAVDLILRDWTRVDAQCARALRGEFSFEPQPGHPLGFLDVSYAGEVATCRPLADPHGRVAAAKRALDPYPPALQAAMIAHLWNAGFLVEVARKAIPKRDVAYIALCCSTALTLCAHARHAHAGVWVTNEKGVVPDTARLAGGAPDNKAFADAARSALAHLGDTHDDLHRSLDELTRLVAATQASVGYRP